MIKITNFKVDGQYGGIPNPIALLELSLFGDSLVEMEIIQQRICAILSINVKTNAKITSGTPRSRI